MDINETEAIVHVEEDAGSENSFTIDNDDTDTADLREEIQELKQKLHDATTDTEMSIGIVWYNTPVARRRIVTDYIQSFIQNTVREMGEGFELPPSNCSVVQLTRDIMIDPCGNGDIDAYSHLGAPIYERAIGRALPLDEGTETRSRMPLHFVYKCWNCWRPDHSMKECREKRNAVMIQIAKNEFSKHHVSKNSAEEVRYHKRDMEQEAYELKIDALKPGALSDKLKFALGMRVGDLEPWLDNMRQYGPPPAMSRAEQWSHDAKDSGVVYPAKVYTSYPPPTRHPPYPIRPPYPMQRHPPYPGARENRRHRPYPNPPQYDRRQRR